MKANYRKLKNSSNLTLSGKGKEWSDTAIETHEQFLSWLSFSDINIDDFKKCMQSKNFSFEVRIVGQSKGIAFLIDDKLVGSPLIYEERMDYGAEEFIVDSMLFFLHIGSEYPSKFYNKAFTRFFKETNLLPKFM